MTSRGDGTRFVACEKHEKKAFASRKEAKAAIRAMCVTGMSEYRCDYVPGGWHIGHMPEALRRGEIGRSALRRSR